MPEPVPIRETPRFLERHFLPHQLAAVWQVSRATVVKWAREEPDLEPLQTCFRLIKGRRRHRMFMWRIPESVAQRIYEKHLGVNETYRRRTK